MRPYHPSLFRSVAVLLLGAAIATGPAPAATTGPTANGGTAFQFLRPQGEGAASGQGDYISATVAGGGIDGVYHYWIEVPPGLGHLVVDLYDADVGAGPANEDDLGRDRARGNFETQTTYSLFGPEGLQRNTVFSIGDATQPAGADATWLALFDSTGDTVRDNFGAAAYTNNDGTLDWAGNWIETNDNNNAGTGQIFITGGELRIGDNGGAASTIEREVNLSAAGFTSASLTYNARTTGVEGTDVMLLQASANGGGSWTTVRTFTGTVASALFTDDLTPYIATNTRIRFIESSGYGNNDFFFVDNLQIKDTGGIRNGHWELRIDMSGDPAGNGDNDDINAVGIRAHDGTPGAGGTELNLYADTGTTYGMNAVTTADNAEGQDYDYFPLITSGCLANKNDFDFDQGNAGSGGGSDNSVGDMVFYSRTPASTGSNAPPGFTQTFPTTQLSANNVWRRDTFSGWVASDVDATEYGTWHVDARIEEYPSNSNYTVLYFGNSQVAAGNLASNPLANTFRIYLPTDASDFVETAGFPLDRAVGPAKPYLEQQLRYGGAGGGNNGPNPPAVGSTSVFTVTVRFVNPTIYAVTFSAANLVTANIPGGGVVYGGAEAHTAGVTLVSQPAVNGTGNITWNPGTVAAGATVLMSYQVKVTPTSAGQRLLVTPTVASGNGTRATYFDETGNTTQARATFTQGPLCELAVTQGLLTPAVVSGFRAAAGEHGGVVVEWQTAGEAGTAGFRLYRRDPASQRWKPLHTGLLAALQSAPQGGTYRFLDEGVQAGEPLVYRLEEVEATGGSRSFGPFRVTADRDSREEPPPMASIFERTAKSARGDATATAPNEPAAGAAPLAAEKAGFGTLKDRLWLGVRSSGLHRMGVDAIAAELGKPAESIAAQLKKGKASLWQGGTAPVAWYPDLDASGNATGILFYGVNAGSIYSALAAYRFDLKESGPQMATLMVSPAAPSPPATFAESRHSETDSFPATVLPLDPESDYWFWDFMVGDDATLGHRSLPLDVPGGTPAPGSLTIGLQGATDSGTADEHRVQVSLNGTALGEVSWRGIAPAKQTLAVPAGVISAAGPNTVETTGLVGAGAPYSITYVDGFDLDYQRTYGVTAGSLTFPAGAQGALVTGFGSPAVTLLEVSNPAQPKWVPLGGPGGAALESPAAGSYQLRFTPKAAGTFVATAVPLAPEGVRPWTQLDPRAADLLIVAPEMMRPGAVRLAGMRQRSGLRVQVATVEEIADTYGSGLATPQAVRAAVAAVSARSGGSLRYLALLGVGTVDYRNLFGFGGNLVPLRMVSVPQGLFAADNRYGDLVGSDHLPEVAVGRIPVRSEAELEAWLDKLAAYEAGGTPDWAGQTVLVSDATDRGASFTGDSDRLAAMVPAPQATQSIDAGALGFAAARSQLLAAWNGGAGMINYYGHGALDRLASGGLLTSGDVATLTNGSKLPLLTAMSCTINRLGTVASGTGVFSSLGEELVRASGRGAIAVLAPSGVVAHDDSAQLARAIYARTGNRAELLLGDWVRAAYGDYARLAAVPSAGLDPALLDLYLLLGDPSMRLLNGPPPPPTAATPGVE